MATDRTIKELLQLTLKLLEIIPEKELHGICGLVFDLYSEDIITIHEKRTVNIYLQDNLPNQRYKHAPGFRWKPGTKTCSYRDWETDRKSTRLNSSHSAKSRMPSSA